ncbi:hypothetical protein BGZ80_009082, partial [Entomortierella chlamydospora]
MDYLLRTLLRVNLAPVRESKNKERAKAEAQKKQDRSEKTVKMTLGLWRSKVQGLCDQLDKALRSSNPTAKSGNHILAITKRLSTLQREKPEVSHTRLPSLEAQLSQLGGSIASAGSDEASLFEDEDDMDDDDDDDD